MRFLFRLDLSLHASAGKKIWNLEKWNWTRPRCNVKVLLYILGPDCNVNVLLALSTLPNILSPYMDSMVHLNFLHNPPATHFLSPYGWLWPCLDPKFLHPKTSHRMFGHMHGVLNEVYLQKFLYGWAVNRETNLMSLLNPWFATVMLQ